MFWFECSQFANCLFGVCIISLYYYFHDSLVLLWLLVNLTVLTEVSRRQEQTELPAPHSQFRSSEMFSFSSLSRSWKLRS